MDDLFGIIYIVGFCFFVANAIRHIRSKPQKKEITNSELVKQHGWVVIIHPMGGEIRCLRCIAPGNPPDLAVRTIACIALLGDIRDEHPNPIVADKAAELLIALNTHSRTVVHN